MASFCSKCGGPLASTTGFCPACGTPIPQETVVPAAPPQATPPPTALGAPPPTGYPVYQQKSSNGVLKIILIVVAVVVVLGVAAAGTTAFIAYRALHSSGNSFALGRSADVDESDLGVAIYPGAAHVEAGGMKLKAGNNSVVSSTYTTSDPAPTVLDFYRGKLGGAVQENQTGRGTSLVSATVDNNVKDSIVVTVTPSSQPNGPTAIMILHTRSGTPAAN